MGPNEGFKHLAALPLGAVEVLTKAQFQLLFGTGPSMEAAKLAAATLTERAGCRIPFIGDESIFARITRQQSRSTVTTAFDA